ncbi:hypothetical protein VTO73DRAFT_14027 [Trametes versicolor]
MCSSPSRARLAPPPSPCPSLALCSPVCPPLPTPTTTPSSPHAAALTRTHTDRTQERQRLGRKPLSR